MKYNKGFAPLVLVAIIAGALVIGGGAYYLGKNSNNKEVKLEEKNVLQENKIVDDSQKDYSNEEFTINESQNSISTTLPKYVGSHSDCGGLPSCWPPIINNSFVTYSCEPHVNQGDATNNVVQKNINGRIYCIKSFGDSYAGGIGWTYTYTTAKGNGTKTTTFGLTYSSCGGYGGPDDTQYKECKKNQTDFASNLDDLIDSLMSK